VNGSTKLTPYQMVGMAGIILLCASLFGVGWTVLGIYGLIAAGPIAALIGKLMPYLVMRFDNQVLVWQKDEARRKPIETLETMAAEIKNEIAALERDEQAFLGDVAVSAEHYREHKRDFPEDTDTLANMDATLAVMQELATETRASIVEAHDNLKAFNHEIKRAKSEYRATTSFNNALGRQIGRSVTTERQGILADEALNAVRENAVRSRANVAALSNRLKARREGMVVVDTSAIAYQPSTVMPPASVAHHETVGRK